LKAEEDRDAELKKLNDGIRSHGGRPITAAEKSNLELKMAIESLERKFDRYWG